MIQWGKIYPNPSAGWTTHSFNTAFPTACSNLVVTQNTTDRGAQSDSTVNISAYNMTRTNFSIRAAYSEAREGISWIAFGY